MAKKLVYPVTEEHFPQFGRIIHYWAECENLLPFLLRGSTTIDTYSAFAIMGALQYLQKKDILRAIHDTKNFPKLSHRDAVLEFLNRMQNEAHLRNSIAHSSWAFGEKTGSIKPASMKTRGDVAIIGFDEDETEYSLKQFTACADRLRKLAKDIRQFSKDHDLGVPKPYYLGKP